MQNENVNQAFMVMRVWLLFVQDDRKERKKEREKEKKRKKMKRKED